MQKTLLLLLFIGLSSLVYSQKFRAGISAGVNGSQVHGDGYSGFRKAGILVGAFSNFDLSDKLNFQFEINYSEKGSRKNPKTDEGDTDFFLLRMNYVEIPVMLRMKKDRFTYEAGAYYGRLVHDYLEDENGPFTIPEQTNQLKNSDLGLLIGINFHFTESLIMNWRYSNSIVPVRKYDSGASFRLNSGLMHNYMSITFRYELKGSENE
jgi:hypothetical protein